MRVSLRALFVLALVVSSHCSQSIDLARNMNKAREAAELDVGDPASESMERVNSIGVKLIVPALVPIVLFLGYGFILGTQLYKSGQDPNPTPKEEAKGGVPLVAITLLLTLGAYFGYLRPSDCSGPNCKQTAPFRVTHDVSFVLHAALFVLAGVALRTPTLNNSASLMIILFALGTLVLGLAFEVFLALCLGKWGRNIRDYTIGTAQENLPGSMIASFASVPSFTLIAVAEALFNDPDSSVAVRLGRLAVVLVAASAHLLSVQSPVHQEGVSHRTVEHWRKGHPIANLVTFVALSAYLLMANNNSKSASMRIASFVITGIATAAVLVGYAGRVLGRFPELSSIVFALSQYLIVAVSPLTLFARYTDEDVAKFQKDMQSIYLDAGIDPSSPEATNQVGNRMLNVLMPGMLWLFLSGISIISIMYYWFHTNTPRSWWVAGMVAIVVVAVASTGLYFGKLRPRECDSSKEDCSQVDLYKGVLDFAWVVFLITLGVSAMALKHSVSSNVPSFVATLFGVLTLFMSLTVQVFLAMALGEWGNQVHDETISTTQDNIPGAKLAGAVTLPSLFLLVLGEALFHDDHMPWIQIVRFVMMLVAMAGYLGVIHAPLELQGVGSKTVDAWEGTHFFAAAVCFGLTALYMFVVAYTAKLTAMSVVGRLVTIVALFLLIGSRFLKVAPETAGDMLALGEYFMVAASPLVLLSRFRTSDTKLLSKMFLSASKHGIFPKDIPRLGDI